ncbi:hypothetical protein GLOIN_2v1485721 [Rhizophagus irregularis DAOM 181602=DAOM 197198]|nr:hypothetical protein GLOIN_2v1485721 [Rhizophagus irregularis DAOM 181602=DAOM 197198]
MVHHFILILKSMNFSYPTKDGRPARLVGPDLWRSYLDVFFIRNMVKNWDRIRTRDFILKFSHFFIINVASMFAFMLDNSLAFASTWSQHLLQFLKENGNILSNLRLSS